MKPFSVSSKVVVAVVAMLAAASVVAVASGERGTAQASRRGGNLVIVRGSDSQTFDETQMNSNPSIWVAKNIYQMLYEEGRNGKTLVPTLATGYTLSKDKKTWTFHLRRGVRFQNGQRMTSADVKFSVLQNMSPKSAWSFIDSTIKSISTPSPYTVVFKTKTATASFLADMSFFGNAIIPKNFAGQSKAGFYNHPIGTGPFGFYGGGVWNKGQSLKLVRNRFYWQPGKPYLHSVTWRVVGDDNARVLQLKGGQAQIDEAPPWSQVDTLRTRPGLKVGLFPASGEEQFGFNLKKAPFNNIHVRRAVAYAIDKTALARAVLFGHSGPANSFLAPQQFGYDPYAHQPTNNVAKARAELAKAAVPHGVTITLHPSSDRVTSTINQILQQDLQRVGIHVKFGVAYDPSTAFAELTKGNYDIGFSDITTDVADPDELATFIVCGTCGVNAWYTGYDNKKVDAWVAAARQQFNPAKRRALYWKIQRQVDADVPFVFLYFDKYPYAMSAKVKGFYAYPTGFYHLENVSLSQ
jgi:peptide/nickel transport system substrate-binding protein